MRKLALLLLALILCLSCAHAEEEEEISMEEILSGAAPEAVQSTITGLETEEATSMPAAESIYESDGSVLITISAVGDFTVGGDSRKSTSIFDDELKRQGGDIHFTMRNTRDIFLADDLTIVNFWATTCGPCISEMPELGEWAREMPENMQIIGVLTDVRADDAKKIAKVEKIMEKAKADFVNLTVDDELYAYFATRMTGTPTTILVNSRGEVVGDAIVGAFLDKYKAAAEAYLSGK